METEIILFANFHQTLSHFCLVLGGETYGSAIMSRRYETKADAVWTCSAHSSLQCRGNKTNIARNLYELIIMVITKYSWILGVVQHDNAIFGHEIRAKPQFSNSLR